MSPTIEPDSRDLPESCPACGRSPAGDAPSGGGILGGAPSAAVIQATSRPHSARPVPALAAPAGPLPCRSCGERLYRAHGELLPHRGTAPMLPMHVAASRLRNHLRRLAITRLDLIEGDAYLLPYYRVEGATPLGDSTFTVLATRLGDDRLDRPTLPPGDIRPWEEPEGEAAQPGGAHRAGLRILPPTLAWREAVARAGEEGWRADRPLELIHYPFWLMRVGDQGRSEGVWMDGTEARLIFQRMRLAAVVPSRRARAGWTALPAAAAAAGAAAFEPAIALPVAAAVWAVSIPLIHGALLRRWNG